MTDASHERWSEELAAYMLGALDPEEASEVERHAEGCKRCRDDLRWLTPVVQVLPETVERLEPPRELRSRILADIRSDAAAAAPAGGAHRSPGRTLRERLAARLLAPGFGIHWRAADALSGALIIVVVALGAYAIGSGDSGGSTPTTTFAVGQPPGVTAQLVREGDRGTLQLRNVNALPENRVLEAWVRRDGEVQPVRQLFVPDPGGRASTWIGDMRAVDLVMVTTEPAGGSLAPTSSPIVKVPIPPQ